MIAFSAGGCLAATCSALKPPQEMPIMPTLPLHQGCAGEPGDHVDRVLQFLLGILVVHQPFGIAVAAHVDADRGVAVAGEIRMGQRVARGGAVALAVGQMLEDRRHRVSRGVRRHPDPRRQPAAVRHDDAHVREFDDLAGKFGDGFHGGVNTGTPELSEASEQRDNNCCDSAVWTKFNSAECRCPPCWPDRRRRARHSGAEILPIRASSR